MASSRTRRSRPTARSIAFSAQYDGNIDVYIVPVAGGAPTRLTWHPGADIVRGFTPDGKAVLFTSPRATSHQPLHAALHRAGRGRCRRGAADPERVERASTRPTASTSPTPRSRRASGSGSTTAAAPPRASGSTTPAAHAVEKVPQPADALQRHRPDVDRRHASTSAPTATASSTCSRTTRRAKQVQQLTKHADFPVLDRHRRRRAASSTSRPATCTCSTRQTATAEAADDRRRRRPARDAAAVRQGGEVHPRCGASRRPARARRSSSAARSSPCRPRRATPAT